MIDKQLVNMLVGVITAERMQEIKVNKNSSTLGKSAEIG